MIQINGKSVDEYVNEQINRGTCEVINVHGTMHRNNGRTIVCSGSVVINKGGKQVVLKGNRIVKENGEWYVDGNKVDTSSVQASEVDEVKIEINGNVENLSTSSGNVTINGDCKSINTMSGDIRCNDVVNINTGSGDVHCRNVNGNISTGSGDIYRR